MERGHRSERRSRDEDTKKIFTEGFESGYDGSDEDSYTTAHSAPSPERATSPTSEPANMSSSTKPANLEHLISKVRSIVGLGISSSDSESSARDVDGRERETPMQYRRRVRRKRGNANLAATNTAHEVRKNDRPSSSPEPQDEPTTEEPRSEPDPSDNMSVMSISSDDRYTAEIDKILPDADEVVEVSPERNSGSAGASASGRGRKFRLRTPRSEQVMAENEAANRKMDELDGLFEPTLKKYGFGVDDNSDEDEQQCEK